MMGKKAIDLIGKRFGMLMVLYKTVKRSKDGCVIWKCVCDCGKLCESISSSLMTSRKQSCGCNILVAIVNSNTKHGMSNSSEYGSYRSMIQRCQNPKSPNYDRYGGRGISVCERWNNFENFLNDMGLKPSQKHSIERIDNSKDYFPENCKWGTPDEQSQNQITTKLDENKVRYIRQNLGVGCRILSEKFHVSDQTIRDVLKYRTWKNII